jgi:N-acetylglutamate synthase
MVELSTSVTDGAAPADPAADRAAAAYAEAIARIAAGSAPSLVRHGRHGSHLLATGLPISVVNLVFVDRPDPDWDEVSAHMSVLAGFAETHQIPWCVRARGAVDPLVAELAAAYGLTTARTLPFMIREPGPLPAVRPDMPSVRPAGPVDASAAADLLADAFAAPAEIIGSAVQPSVLAVPDVEAHVADLDGTLVGAGLTIATRGQIGLYSIGVPVALQGRGYGYAVTRGMLLATGATEKVAYLHASDAGRPVYERLGFRVVEEWTDLGTGD